MTEKLSRRQFLEGLAVVGSGAILAACAPAAPAEPEIVEKEVVIKETVIVEVEGTPEVQEVERVVTATAPPAEPVTIHFTHQIDPTVYDPFAIDLAKEQLPNIDLVIDLTAFGSGWDDYSDNLMTRIAGGEGLDVIYTAIEGMPFLVAANAVLPLDPFLEADPEAKDDFETDIHPVLMDVLNWKGDQILIPSGWNNMVIHYNYKIFEEKGVAEPTFDWTWDDFVDACLELADVQGTEDDLYACSFWYSAFGISPWYFNNDTSPFKNDWTDSNMDDPKVAETLQFLADLMLKHKVHPSPEGWDEWGQFHSNHLAMRGCGGWCISGANNAEFYDYKLQYYPHNAGPLKTVVGVGGHGVATTCPHPDEAWEVVKLLMSQEVQANYVQIDGSPCSRRSVVVTPAFTDRALPAPADMDIYYASLDYADVVPSPPNFTITDPLLMRWYSQIWNGTLSVEEAVAGAHEELQAEMDLIKE